MIMLPRQARNNKHGRKSTHKKTRFLDQMDDDLAARQEPKVLSRTMGGTFAQQITTKTGE
jgi:hypothetical protein